MAYLNGYVRSQPVMATPGNQPDIQIGGPVNPSGATVVVDGTPIRVVTLALAAAAGLAALKWAGFRFNVGI